MEFNSYNMLVRIAEALERQCEQTSEWTERQLAWRAESIERSQLRHDKELGEVKATNARLLKQIDEALQLMGRTLALHERREQPQSADAVDPHLQSEGKLPTREKAD